MALAGASFDVCRAGDYCLVPGIGAAIEPNFDQNPSPVDVVVCGLAGLTREGAERLLR